MSGPLQPLACPYCLGAIYAYDAYDDYDDDVVIGCDECGAGWDRSGTPSDGPRTTNHPTKEQS